MTLAEHQAGLGSVQEIARVRMRNRMLRHLPLVLCALTAALGPAYVVRWHIGFYPTTLLETAILVTLAVFALAGILAGQALEWRSVLTLPTALFIMAGCLSVLDAPSRTAALGIFRAY